MSFEMSRGEAITIAFMLLFLALLSACTPIAEAYLIGTSQAMQAELRNGAIVRAEMRARGELPWSSWPWAPRRRAIFEDR